MCRGSYNSEGDFEFSPISYIFYTKNYIIANFLKEKIYHENKYGVAMGAYPFIGRMRPG